jgi:hypothetical protein
VTNEPTTQDVIEPVVEIDDPDGMLGVAKTVAAAMLNDPDRVRALLGDTAAKAILLSAARTLEDNK